MDNKAIANILYETADLLEIDGQDSFRIRSYRNAAQAIENHSQQIKRAHCRSQAGARDPRHRQKHAAQSAGALSGRQARGSDRTAREIPSLDAAVAEDSRPGTENHRADLERLPSQRRRWRRETGARRKNPRTAAHGRKARSQATEGHRRLSPHQRAFPDRRRRSRGRKAHRISREIPRHRQDHARRIAAPRPRNRGRSRHAGHWKSLRQRRRPPAGDRLRREISAVDGRDRQR